MAEDIKNDKPTNLKKKKWTFTPESFALLSIVLLSAFFRFVNLRSNPRWYSDELVYINTAWNLMHGIFQVGPVKWTFFSSFLPNPPLYSIINGILLLFHYDILTTRMWVALCGVLTTIILYFTGKELVNKKAGLLSAFFFSIYPLAIVHNRRGWPHNQAMLLIMLAFFSCLKYRNTRDKKWLSLTIVSCGLATLTSYWVVGLVIFVFGFYFFTDKKTLKTVVPGTLSFFIIFFILALLKFKGDMIFDIKSTLVMTMAQSKGKNLLLFVAGNYISFLKIDLFIALGCIGLFFTPKKFEKISLLSIFALLSFEIFRQRETIPAFFYPAVILTPFICMGLAILVDQAACFIDGLLKKRMQTFIMLVMIIPFLPVAFQDFVQTFSGFKTPEDLLAAEDSRDTEETAKFINNNTTDYDFVLATSYLSWLLKCRSADLLVTALQEGRANDIYTLITDNKRFAYDCSYKGAKYFVTDSLTRKWIIYEDGVTEIIFKMEMEGWTKVFEKGEYRVFENPRFSGKAQPNAGIIIENPGVYSEIAQFYFDRKVFGLAESMLKKALFIAPRDISNHFNLASVYLSEGKKDGAANEYRAILQIEPSNQNALSKLQLLTGASK